MTKWPILVNDGLLWTSSSAQAGDRIHSASGKIFTELTQEPSVLNMMEKLRPNNGWCYVKQLIGFLFVSDQPQKWMHMVWFAQGPHRFCKCFGEKSINHGGIKHDRTANQRLLKDES